MRRKYPLYLSSLLLILLCPLLLSAQEESVTYRADLAEQLGADDYGMRVYHLALLRPGPHRQQDSLTAAGIQQGHMRYIQELSVAGKLVLAGPFLEQEHFRGVFILNTTDAEEARGLCDGDPAVQAGRLEALIIPWYASASLPLLAPIHQSIQKIGIGD